MKLEQLLPPSVRAKLRKSSIRANHFGSADLAGRYRSAFKGNGLTFSELREYAHGDDVRLIDWKSSARSERVYIKSYEEERQLRLLVLLDCSASVHATANPMHHNYAVQAAAMLAYMARESHDEFGLALFSEQLDSVLPPNSHRGHWHNVTKTLAETQQFKHPTLQKVHQTSVAQALKEVQKYLNNRTTTFIISDFYTEDWKQSLASVSSRHTTICLHLNAPIESWLPKAGLTPLKDAETLETYLVDSSCPRTRTFMAEKQKQHAVDIQTLCKKNSAHYTEITSSVEEPIFRFLRSKKKR
jgi:uncharacterized protein (DUF58 family)